MYTLQCRATTPAALHPQGKKKQSLELPITHQQMALYTSRITVFVRACALPGQFHILKTRMFTIIIIIIITINNKSNCCNPDFGVISVVLYHISMSAKSYFPHIHQTSFCYLSICQYLSNLIAFYCLKYSNMYVFKCLYSI